ncbi:uncharacterized protein LOC129000664 [Macrosteles quadrilineatus]|uniref:uncharacterized protein LOC129000664 n=1 Tax=Macrosteles quadrilineatus TaxID=74068 RepID=UPI0023E21AF0|nr:uncharacterized protein LOC129000664 [Macrosteles quadrilineatus]
MFKVLSVISVMIMVFLCVFYYMYPSVFKKYNHKLVNPGTWGTIEIVQEKPIGNIKNIFHSQILWQILENLCGFVTGVLFCGLIGRSFSNTHLTSMENSLKESTKRLHELQQQVANLREKLLTQESMDTPILAEESQLLLTHEEVTHMSQASARKRIMLGLYRSAKYQSSMNFGKDKNQEHRLRRLTMKKILFLQKILTKLVTEHWGLNKLLQG